MITYHDYNRLFAAEMKRELTKHEKSQMAEFENSQPRVCPKCGFQVFDPFSGRLVVHDINHEHTV